MAKFNIEVELEWMEEDSYSIDEDVYKRQVCEEFKIIDPKEEL